MTTRLANLFTRRDLLAGGAGSLLLARRAAAQARQSRPNILWIIAEDFSPDLGCYGNRLVRTGNIDRLAAEGVRFERAFVTGPVCSASRSALATGMYQTSIGAHHHRSHRGDGYRLPAGIRVFTHYFREAGYHTSNVITPAPGVRGTGKTDFNFTEEKPFEGTDWNQRRTGQPFYAQVNFQETHRAFRRSPERPIRREDVVLPPYYADDPAIREDWAMYLETAQNLDNKVGKVIERLKEEKLLDETVIFFFGDHGRPMPRGKQFLYDEGIRIPLIVRIPEKFRPAGWKPGSARTDFVSAIDVTATSLKLAAIEPPAHMQGQVVIGPGAKARDSIVAARDRCDETMDHIRCVRTARYKYIRNFLPERAYTQPNNYKDTSYPTLRAMRQLHARGRLAAAQAPFMAERRPAEELYDLEADPHELRNLAASPAHKPALDQLRGKLKDWMAATRDQGETPEPKMPEEEYKYRTQVEGWCTREYSRASSAGGALTVRCSGNANGIMRSVVTAGGELTCQFRARASGVQPQSLFWATIDYMMNRPDPQHLVRLDFAANGEWREYSVPFHANGFLGLLGLDLGPGEGTVEFDWIRLSRQTASGLETIERWDFAK